METCQAADKFVINGGFLFIAMDITVKHRRQQQRERPIREMLLGAWLSHQHWWQDFFLIRCCVINREHTKARESKTSQRPKIVGKQQQSVKEVPYHIRFPGCIA